MSEFDDYLSDFYTQWNGWVADRAGSDQDMTNAEIAYSGGDDHAALGSLILAVRHHVEGFQGLGDTYTYPYPRYNIVKLFDLIGGRLDDLEIGGGYVLTMGAITSVMITATEDELRYFIGLVDAYRVGLWNKPFNAEYFAALARGFAL